MNRDEGSLTAIWQRFRLGGELRLLTCLAGTIAVGLVLAAVALAVAWLVAHQRGLSLFGPGGPALYHPVELRWPMLAAAVPWLVSMYWLWRPLVRLNRHSLSFDARRTWVRPITLTMVIAAVLIVSSFVIFRQAWPNSEYLVTSCILIGGAIAIVGWLPVVHRLEQPRPIVGPDRRVNVHCTRCGYSMEGLRQTTCPECGREYTIDELILAQRYVGAGNTGDSEGRERPLAPTDP